MLSDQQAIGMAGKVVVVTQGLSNPAMNANRMAEAAVTALQGS